MQQISNELKTELVQKLINHDLTVFDVASHYHINPPIIYLWLREQGQLYPESELVTPEVFNLSGQAHYVVTQSSIAAAVAAQASATAAAEASASNSAAPAPAPESSTSAESKATESVAAPEVAAPAEPAPEIAASAEPVPATSEVAVPVAETAPEASEVAAAPVAPTSVPFEVAAADTANSETMAFPIPKADKAELQDLNAELGLKSAPAQNEYAPAKTTKAHAAEPLPLAEEAEESDGEDDDFSGDDWNQIDLDKVDLELAPTQEPEVPETATASATAESADDEDEDEDSAFDAEFKAKLMQRLDRKEITVNAASDFYDIPQFMIYQWIAEHKAQQAQAAAAQEAAEQAAAQEAKTAAPAPAADAASDIQPDESQAVESQEGAESKVVRRGPMFVSGDRKIKLVALACAGTMPNSKIAAGFHVSMNLLSKVVSEAKEQGLMAWCTKQRALDQEHPAAAGVLERERQEEVPQVLFGKVKAFKLAAVDAVLNHGLSGPRAAQCFGLSLPELYSWTQQAKEQGFDSWAHSIGCSASDFAWVGYHPAASITEDAAVQETQATEAQYMHRGSMSISGDRKIKLVALVCAGTMPNAEIAAGFHVLQSSLTRCVNEAKKQGLLAWCTEQRKLDQEHPSATSLLERERQEEVPQVQLAKIKAFKLAAVDAVLRRDMGTMQVAQCFGFSYHSLYNWVQQAQAQGFELWARNMGCTDEDWAWVTGSQDPTTQEQTSDESSES